MSMVYEGGLSLTVVRIVFLIVTLLYIADLMVLVPKYTKCKYDHTPRRRKLVWKGACIAAPLIALVCGVAMQSVKAVYVPDLILVAAMTFCAVGDIVIEIRFFKGGLLFFAGHILYVTALLFINEKISGVAVVVYLILAVCGTVLTIQKLGRKYRPFLIGYNLMISGSFALSLPLILTLKPALVFLGTGACFLAVSDWLLARNKVYKSSCGWSLLSLMFYFGGQILISAYPYLK